MDYILLLILLSPYTAWVALVYFAVDGYKKKYTFKSTPINWCLVALAGIAIVSGILNQDLLSIGGAAVFLAFIGMNNWMAHRLTSLEKIETLVRRFWHISLVTGFIGVIEKVASKFVDMSWFAKLFFNPTYFPTKLTYRTMSTFGNPNIAGDWFAILALISFFLMEKEVRNPKASFKYKLGAILFTANLMFTGSKGALVAFVIGIIFYCVLKKSKQLWHNLSVIMLFIGVSLVFSFDLFNSMNFRNEIWRKCFVMISEKPLFGSGFMGILNRIGEPHAHNIWISITTSLGFMGLIVLLFFSFVVFKYGIHTMREKVTMSRLNMSIMAILFIHGFVDFTLLAPQTSMLFMGVAQMMYLLSKQTSLAKQKQTKVYRVKKQVLSSSGFVKMHSKLG